LQGLVSRPSRTYLIPQFSGYKLAHMYVLVCMESLRVCDLEIWMYLVKRVIRIKKNENPLVIVNIR